MALIFGVALGCS